MSELKQGYDDGSGMERITDDEKAVLTLRWGCGCCQDLSDLTEEENAFAKKVIHRWNAFENGGIVEELRDVVKDMLSGLAYLRDTKTEPYGFGIDRLEKTGKAALAKS